jgi:hypothetical protein
MTHLVVWLRRLLRMHPSTPGPLYVIGDVHGQLVKLVKLLRAAGLVDGELVWSGGQAALWCIGDFVDRGPDGVGVIDLVMRLQREARAAGGQVGALLGNHDVLLLAARRFGARLVEGRNNGSFRGDWLESGGQERDLVGLRWRHEEWLAALPAMALVDERLLVHADSAMYLEYGASVQEVNQRIHAVLRGDDARAWAKLLDDFARRREFTGERPVARVRDFLELYGGRKLVHGHSPIRTMSDLRPEETFSPWVYADGLCVNVDGGMGTTGPGFVAELPLLSEQARR